MLQTGVGVVWHLNALIFCQDLCVLFSIGGSGREHQERCWQGELDERLELCHRTFNKFSAGKLRRLPAGIKLWVSTRREASDDLQLPVDTVHVCTPYLHTIQLLSFCLFIEKEYKILAVVELLYGLCLYMCTHKCNVY